MGRPTSLLALLFAVLCAAVPVAAQGIDVAGTVRDQTGDALPGVAVELTATGTAARRTQPRQGGYASRAYGPRVVGSLS